MSYVHDGMPGLDCDLHREGDVARVAPSGELDVASLGAVERRVEEALNGGVRSLVLDLSGLTFMASTGLRLVLQLVERAAEDGFELAVVRGPRQVQRVFDLTGTSARVPWVES